MQLGRNRIEGILQSLLLFSHNSLFLSFFQSIPHALTTPTIPAKKAVQTVNLLALRLQWFESTPTQATPRANLQVLKPFGGQLSISSSSERTNPFPSSKNQ